MATVLGLLVCTVVAWVCLLWAVSDSSRKSRRAYDAGYLDGKTDAVREIARARTEVWL